MRTNARIGRQVRTVKSLFIMTCNDQESLIHFRKSFLWDRFVNQLHCPLPGREVMHRILLDKIAHIPGGNPVWADLAMALAARLNVKSPRKIVGFLAARHRLEDGSYQRDVLQIVEEERLEKAGGGRPSPQVGSGVSEWPVLPRSAHPYP
jgi:hypothetical protein